MYKNVLVAYDASELSKKAITEAKNLLSENPETNVHIVPVITPAGPTTNAIIARNIANVLADNFKPEMEKIKKEFEDDNLSVTTEILIEEAQRNPGKEICNYAEKHDIDLIILGSRGLGAVKRLFLGSVSNYIVQHAQCHVLIVKQANTSNSFHILSALAAKDSSDRYFLSF